MKIHLLYHKERHLFYSCLLAIGMFVASLVVYYYAGTYASKMQSNTVTDIVLSNIRVFAVDDIFVYAVVAFAMFILVWCFTHPRQLPYIMKSIAVFILIRSVFFSLTHIGTPADSAAIDEVGLTHYMNFGADLFFSGHTGLPFLMGLIFWNTKWLRYMFIVLAFIFGAVVLLGHYHYTIDVIAAFFIVYAINDINRFLFKKDLAYFNQ